MSDEFRELQAQRIYEHLFNGGPLSPEGAAARYQGLLDEVQDAIKGEAIRWGDPPSNLPDWRAEADFIINTLIPSRREGVLDQYRRFRLYPQTDAPVFSQQGGPVLSQQPLEMTANEGVIYYTVDGSDPRLSDGTVSAQARVYGQPIVLDQTTAVRARALANDAWSVYNEALFVVGDPAPQGAVVVTEINYNPADASADPDDASSSYPSDQFEFIEFYNRSEQPVDLAGVKLTDAVDFTFPAHDVAGERMWLQPNEYVVVASNLSAFQARYGSDGIRVAGQYTGKLDNAGERIRLAGPLGTSWLDFGYDDADDWPQRADGDGGTLLLRDPPGIDPAQLDFSASWQGSRAYGGTPGAARQDPVGVVINEVLTRTDDNSHDAIELYNASSVAVNVGGWYLSDSSNNLFKYQLPAGTIIAPG